MEDRGQTEPKSAGHEGGEFFVVERMVHTIRLPVDAQVGLALGQVQAEVREGAVAVEALLDALEDCVLLGEREARLVQDLALHLVERVLRGDVDRDHRTAVRRPDHELPHGARLVQRRRQEVDFVRHIVVGPRRRLRRRVGLNSPISRGLNSLISLSAGAGPKDRREDE